MKVIVLEEKIRKELQSEKKYVPYNPKLTKREVDALLARLSFPPKLEHVHVIRMAEVRSKLGVTNDMQLAFLLYHRGYVIIEDKQ